MDLIIGKNIKLVRENSGYTQKQVAEFLGLNSSSYANYESGERTVPLSVLEGVAKLFGVDMSLFFEADQSKIQSSLLSAFKADGLRVEDMKQVADFNDVVMSYLKMIKLLDNNIAVSR